MTVHRSGPGGLPQPLAAHPLRDHPTGLRRASFTERIVAELAPHIPPLPCCRAALIEGMALAGEGGSPVTTRLVSARAALAVLHADAIPASVERLATARRHRYRVTVRASGVPTPAPAPARGLPTPAPARAPGPTAPGASPVPPVPSANLCCCRSRLRGVFLACGSLARGDGPPQLELLVGSDAAAARVAADLERLDIPSTIPRRRGRPVVAVRSAPGVATLLSSIGAHLGRLEFESGRVVREVRSGVNRRLNAETANLHRTVAAAVSQLEAIDRLERDRSRWDRLPPALREAAVLRRRHPRDSLEALAATAGCSRPAMAGRLHRLVAIGGAGEER
ncbi:MAG: DNA-binding protein WhiA [Candidatus Dormibacteria bacterium]